MSCASSSRVLELGDRFLDVRSEGELKLGILDYYDVIWGCFGLVLIDYDWNLKLNFFQVGNINQSS